MFEKSIISPVLAVIYLVVSVTGTFLFFHVHNGVIITLHEWMGIIFVLVGILHLSLNWKILKGYLKGTKGLMAIGTAAVFFLVLVVMGSFDKPERGADGERHHYPRSYSSGKGHR